MTKTKLVEDLKEYFASKGKFLTYAEYVEAEDAPYRPQIIKRMVGSWARLRSMVGMVEPEVVSSTQTLEDTQVQQTKEEAPVEDVKSEEPVKAPTKSVEKKK